MLSIGWFGFNVMSARSLGAVSGLVAINSLMAMIGGIIMATLLSKADPGFVHNGALAGLVAVCAGSDVFHPLGALVVGGVAGAIFVKGFTWTRSASRSTMCSGLAAARRLCGLWGGLSAGVFGLETLGGMGGVSPVSQLIGSLALSAYALVAGLVLYTLTSRTLGIQANRRAAAARCRPLHPLDRGKSGGRRLAGLPMARERRRGRAWLAPD